MTRSIKKVTAPHNARRAASTLSTSCASPELGLHVQGDHSYIFSYPSSSSCRALYCRCLQLTICTTRVHSPINPLHLQPLLRLNPPFKHDYTTSPAKGPHSNVQLRNHGRIKQNHSTGDAVPHRRRRCLHWIPGLFLLLHTSHAWRTQTN
jgi:hypothetical protein